MRGEVVKELPDKAFATGISKLKFRHKLQGVVILGFDTEYDSGDQSIISYQLSDGELKNSVILERSEDLTWQELSDWVLHWLKAWGYTPRDLSTILLVSHFSTAELSHIKDFWQEGEVRRVSAAQVYNASYRINKHLLLTVMDNYHFWNVGNNGNASLFAVGEKFGEQKVVLPPDLPIEKTNRAYLKDPRFLHYALWDAVICARVFRKFRDRLWEDHEIDVIQYPTSASLAMAVYRRHFLSEDLPAPEPRVRRQAWHSLWGGRAEAYRQGDFFGKYRLRDVTSLYPTSARILRALPGPNDWVERETPNSWHGLCRVQFRFPKHIRYPCLPVCSAGKLIFPRSGVSDCTLDEAKAAEILGAELSFLKVFEYDSGDTSLTDFMQHFARVKADCEVEDANGVQKDSVGRELSKLMMNSLIGKLSQNRGDVDIEEMKAFAAKEHLPLEVCLDPHFFHPAKPKARPRIGGNIMPEWSALILGKARSIMALLLNEISESLICSTDSLLVPEELNDLVSQVMVKHGVVLTDKNKGKVTHRVRVVRNRVYAAETKEGELVFGASHAIHLGSRRNDCEACKAGKCDHPLHNSLRFILSDEVKYTKTEKLGLKTAIKRGERFFSEKPEKQMSFSRLWDDKRKLLPDGDSVPWEDVEEHLRCRKM